MTDDRELEGLNPYACLDEEADRIDRFFSGLSDEDAARPSRCAGWSVRDVLAHLRAGEEYHQACLDGRVAALLAEAEARGGRDLDSFNELGVRDQDGKSVAQLLAEWRPLNADTRRRFRERGDGVVDTSVGDYPARWQAVHVAAELATHADDCGVPVPEADRARRRDWRARYSRFALAEVRPDVAVAALDGGRTRVGSFEVDDDTLIEGVVARLDESSGLSAEQRALLSTMPSSSG
jgi:uncharacterized protein (TIGR03083 family)